MSNQLNRFFCHLVWVILLCAVVSCESNHDNIEYVNGALSPQEGLASLTAPPGFQVELVVSEPLITDPVDMVIDENGNFYVVEMHGYPLDKSGQGRFKRLTDADGEGRMVKSTVCADGRMWRLGVMRGE